jgi:hypothetical protein
MASNSVRPISPIAKPGKKLARSEGLNVTGIIQNLRGMRMGSMARTTGETNLGIDSDS